MRAAIDGLEEQRARAIGPRHQPHPRPLTTRTAEELSL
jgi:hypothetical protein